MYNAPAVTYPVGRSRFQAGVTLAVVLAGGVAQAVWWLQSAVHGAGHVVGAVLWLASCGWVIWYGLRTPQAQLVWDGQAWSLCAGMTSQLVVPTVIIDMQHSLLLCLRPASGAASWVWPAQRSHPVRWLSLRRALFNPAADLVERDQTRLAASPQA